jgi:hypothetical protein
VNPQAGGLADDAELRSRAEMQHRPWPVWQMRFAEPAGANFCKDPLQSIFCTSGSGLGSA